MKRLEQLGWQAASVSAMLARTLVAEKMVKRTRAGKTFLPEMVTFILLDVVDGVFARKAGSDGKLRRSADAILDRISVARVGWAVSQEHPPAKVPFVALFAREVVVAAVNTGHYLRTNEIVRGGRLAQG